MSSPVDRKEHAIGVFFESLLWFWCPDQQQERPAGLHDNFLVRVPIWIWPRCLKFAARHPPFLSCNWKNSWHECPKTDGGRDYLSTWSRHSSVLMHSCHEFFHLHDKNRGCRVTNFRHWGQIQTGTVPKKLSCKPGFIRVLIMPG